MEKTRLNHDGLFNLEQPLLKVPAEQVKKAARTSQRYVEYVMKELTAEITKLSKSGKPEDAVKVLGEMTARLTKLKHKLAETKGEERVYISRTSNRIEHLTTLMGITNAESEDYARWCQTRLDRVMVDYMLRNGFRESARRLAEEKGVLDLVDVGLFDESWQIVEALKSRSCTECLRWCADNRSSLEKIQSTLEFQIRLQEYIELVRNQKREEAIKYARKYLVNWRESHLKEIQQAMALLAFGPGTSCEYYRDLFDESRWNMLIDQFHADMHALHNLTAQPLLTMSLQAGLSALKTPSCYDSHDHAVNCPVCAEDTFGLLAEKLPNAHHVNSCIVDRISGYIMDEHNPPLVLPNGHVYSTQTLEDMALQHDGVVKCSKTGESYHLSTTRKAYIM
ncbi:CTLH/CRA C-terminal to lish motif domain-containing protein [Gaertneriomyces semiglobifer]|nr:CTLH/CRA C-terminal to lish motif domain-containing protein [Gaertneriomyces semiglobifer]